METLTDVLAAPPPPLFVYGTLRDPDILGAVLGRVLPDADQRQASAADVRAVYFPGQVYPALVVAAGAHADGLVIAGLTPADFAALDHFEGSLYQRGPIAVSAAGVAVAAHAYWPTLAIAGDAPRWSLAEWQSLHKPAVFARETAAAAAARAGHAAR